jgi:hypothetical protein
MPNKEKIVAAYTWIDGKLTDMYPKPTMTHVKMLPDGKGYLCPCGGTYKNIQGHPNHKRTIIHRVMMGELPISDLKRGRYIMSRPVG